MNQRIKAGDRVRVYGAAIGVDIDSPYFGYTPVVVDSVRNDFVYFRNTKGSNFLAHIKQCRKLVKKSEIKKRRRVWLDERKDMYDGTIRLSRLSYLKKRTEEEEQEYKYYWPAYTRAVEFIEVLE